MIYQDDRNDDQRKTHPYLVIATDKFMSGWGGASGGASVCAWACTADQYASVERWVRSRPEMLRVRYADERNGKYRPRNAAHFHIYFVGENHPALRG